MTPQKLLAESCRGILYGVIAILFYDVYISSNPYFDRWHFWLWLLSSLVTRLGAVADMKVALQEYMRDD